MIYTCVRCGIEFEAKHKTAVCQNCHTAVCCICGKEFNLISPYTQKTCSPTCRGIYRKQSGISKQVAAKASATVKQKYNVDNAGMITHVFTKKCAYCSKVFQTTSSRQRYCEDDHYGPCPVCGKPSKITQLYGPVPTCSPECKQAKIEQTCLMKYGSTCSVSSKHGIEAAKKTNLEKYGVDWYSKTGEYKEKFRETSLAKYGTANPMQSDQIKDKTATTNLAKYGERYLMNVEEFRQKSQSTCARRYGGVGMASDILRDKIQSTNLEKYGSISPMQNNIIKEKAKQTCLSKYGYRSWKSSPDGLKQSASNPDKLDNYLKFRSDPARFISENFDHTPSCKEIIELTGVTDTPVYNILINTNNRDLATFHMSTMELQINQLLHELVPNATILRNCRSVITPYELDFYLPEYQFAIECNPTATHNSSFADPWGTACKSYQYHKMKSVMCRDSDVFLFHIFGYEWETRRDVIKSMIRNLLRCNEVKIYARNTSLQIVGHEEGKKFLSENHRQGAVAYSTGLGLYHGGELVSLMCFNKMRSTAGKTADDTSQTYELSRFCNKMNTTVIGSASKLFKYYVNNFQFDKIVSFSDIAHTKGGMYENLGFVKIRESSPSYVWVDLSTEHYLSRVACMKSNLCRTLHDENVDMNLTEREIMESHNYVRVYDSGTIRWEYSR